MTPDPRLLSHPAVRAEAERLLFEYVHAASVSDSDVYDVDVLPFLHLLSDPSRPETRDWMVRGIRAKLERRMRRMIIGGPPQGETAKVAPDYEKVVLRDVDDLRDDPDALVREWLEVHRDA